MRVVARSALRLGRRMTGASFEGFADGWMTGRAQLILISDENGFVIGCVRAVAGRTLAALERGMCNLLV